MFLSVLVSVGYLNSGNIFMACLDDSSDEFGLFDNYQLYNDILDEFDMARDIHRFYQSKDSFKRLRNASYRKLSLVGHLMTKYYNNAHHIKDENMRVNAVRDIFSSKAFKIYIDFKGAIFCGEFDQVPGDSGRLLKIVNLKLIGLDFSKAEFIQVDFSGSKLFYNDFTGAFIYNTRLPCSNNIINNLWRSNRIDFNDGQIIYNL